MSTGSFPGVKRARAWRSLPRLAPRLTSFSVRDYRFCRTETLEPGLTADRKSGEPCCACPDAKWSEWSAHMTLSVKIMFLCFCVKHKQLIQHWYTTEEMSCWTQPSRPAYVIRWIYTHIEEFVTNQLHQYSNYKFIATCFGYIPCSHPHGATVFQQPHYNALCPSEHNFFPRIVEECSRNM